MYKTTYLSIPDVCAIFMISSLLSVFCLPTLYASEVFEETGTKVIVREHPKTGKPYVSIASAADESNGLFPGGIKYSRPDYRMLDPNTKSGEIPYDGPYSSAKKVYIFAATLATLGTVGGAVGIATLPASTGAAATGGGTYLAGGAAVAGATASVAALKMKPNPQTDDFSQESQSKSNLN